MLHIYYAVWCVGPALELSALCRMARNAVGRGFPFVMTYLAVCSIRSAVLISTWHNQQVYYKVYDSTLPIALLVQSLAIVEVFWAMVEQYPNFRRIGATGLAVLGAAGAMAAWLTNGYGLAPYPTLRDVALMLQRHGSLAMMVSLIGIAVLLPRSAHIPIRATAVRAAMILGIDAMLYLLVAVSAMAVTPYALKLPFALRVAGTLAPLFSKALIGALWLFWMTPRAHVESRAEPFTEADRWELARIKLRLRPSEWKRYSVNDALKPRQRAR